MAGNDTLNVPVSGHTVDPAPGGARDLAEHQCLRDGEADELVAQLWEGFGVPQGGGLKEADEQRHSLPACGHGVCLSRALPLKNTEPVCLLLAKHDVSKGQ